MQTSVPEVTDTSDEPDYIYDLYGPDSRDPGTFAANCLLAQKARRTEVLNSSNSTIEAGIITVIFPHKLRGNAKRRIRLQQP